MPFNDKYDENSLYPQEPKDAMEDALFAPDSRITIALRTSVVYPSCPLWVVDTIAQHPSAGKVHDAFAVVV